MHKIRIVWNSRSSSGHEDLDRIEEEESNPFGDACEDDEERMHGRQNRPWERSFNEFKVDILEFKRQLDLVLFMD